MTQEDKQTKDKLANQEQDGRIIEPCEHMEQWVNGLADGSLKGVARFYTRFHISTCLKCRTALIALEGVRHTLADLNKADKAQEQALTPERQAALNEDMNAVEERHRSTQTT